MAFLKANLAAQDMASLGFDKLELTYIEPFPAADNAPTIRYANQKYSINIYVKHEEYD